MKWLQRIDELLNEQFKNSNWADELNTDSTVEEFTKNLIIKEREILISAFEFLNFSVLEGEYVYDKNEFDDKLKLLFNKVGSYQNTFINTDDDGYSFSQALNNLQFLYSLKKAIEVYKRIADNINKQIANLHKNIVIDVSDTFDGTNKYFSKKDDVLEESLFDLFNNNLILSRTGFFLENDNGEFRYLLETKDTLLKLKGKIDYPETNYNLIIDVLVEMCVFYQRKIITRIGQDESRFNDGYIFNLKEYDFSLTQHELTNDYFKEWDEYSQNHFYSETSKEREIVLRKNAEEIIKVQKSPIDSFSLAHSLIKYYKDINPNLGSLEKIKIFFDEYVPKTPFNEFAYNVSKNYLMNNILSLKMTDIQLNEIDDLIIEYKELQESSSINNFFPFYKICLFLKIFLEKNIALHELRDSTIHDNELALEKLKYCFKLYKNNFQWSEQHLHYAFQLPFEESNIKIERGTLEHLNLFIPCSFSLTIDYTKYNDFSKATEFFILNSENEINSIKNISIWTNKLKEKEKEIQKELKDQSKKNVELLGVFSAIIALLYQGINTAERSGENFTYKILTFITMFVILTTFLLLLHFFINHKKKE